MRTRSFALVFGIVFALVGVGGFLPFLVEPLHPGHPEVVGNGGQLLGLFPINLFHNLVHLLFGVWGLVASRSTGASITYARVVAVSYALLTVAGFVPDLNTLFGFVPLYGNDIWLHAALALVAAYFGWVNRNPAHG